MWLGIYNELQKPNRVMAGEGFLGESQLIYFVLWLMPSAE
jgi:hypothetical protein